MPKLNALFLAIIFLLSATMDIYGYVLKDSLGQSVQLQHIPAGIEAPEEAPEGADEHSDEGGDWHSRHVYPNVTGLLSGVDGKPVRHCDENAHLQVHASMEAPPPEF